jgi:hypothetical protein
MAKFTFYCRVDRENPAQGIKAGMYSYRSEHKNQHVFVGGVPNVRTLIRNSSKVWREGPRGGIKIIKNRNIGYYGYVTTNEEYMKEFFWVKLQAQAV